MAEPPRRSEILIPDDKVIIYYATFSVEGRRPVLANSDQSIGRGGTLNRPRAIRVNRPYLARVECADWPYYLDFINDGKLTASPTETAMDGKLAASPTDLPA